MYDPRDDHDRMDDKEHSEKHKEHGHERGKEHPTGMRHHERGPGEAHEDVVASGETESVSKQLEVEKAKAEDYLQHWQRSQADFINYKRRVEQERLELAKYANSALILKILPVLDDFDRAFANIGPDIRQAPWLEGIDMIDRKLRTILEQEGVKPIEALGAEFDPTMHEAVLFEEGADLKHGKVVAELQKGYKLHDRVIRPALVKVGQMPSDASASD